MPIALSSGAAGPGLLTEQATHALPASGRICHALAALGCLLALALVLTGCGGGSTGASSTTATAPTAPTTTPTTDTGSVSSTAPPAAKTAIGAAAGAPASTTIGAAGGTLASPDGRLVLTVPAGALPAATTVSIQPISATAPGALGIGYRLQPEGVTFAAPVTLRMTYTDADVAGGSAQTLGIATQAANGTWSRETASVDTVARTVSVTTTHFSDWSLVQGLALRPGEASVGTGQSLPMRLTYCFAAPSGGTTEFGYDCDTDIAPLAWIGNCAVNGVAGGTPATGTVRNAGGDVTYVAPSSAPSPSTVAVSCEVTKYGGTSPGGKQVLVSNVTVIGDYSGTIGGTVAFSGNTWTIAPANLSGFTLIQEDSIPGDVTKWIGRVTATITQTLSRCSTVTAQGTIEVTLLVWDPNSGSANGDMAKAYSIDVTQTETAFASGTCDGQPTLIPVAMPAMSTRCPPSLGNEQKYTSIGTLSGSSNLSCSVGPAQLNWQMAWSLTGR